MGKGRNHWWRHLAATLGTLALLVHVVLAAAHVPPSVSAPVQAPVPAAEHCHEADGADEAPPHHQPAHKSHPLPPCPICQSLHLDGAYLTPTSASIAPAPRSIGRLGPAVAERAAVRRSVAGFQARAPPAAA